MPQEIKTIKGLEDLPVFASDRLKTGKSVPIHEEARMTTKGDPQIRKGVSISSFLVEPRQRLVYVVGRSLDSQVIYFSGISWLHNGNLVTTDYCVEPIGTDSIEKYEIMIPHEHLREDLPNRRI